MHDISVSGNAIIIDTVPYTMGDIVVDAVDWLERKITLRTTWNYSSAVIQKCTHLDIEHNGAAFSNVTEVQNFIIEKFFGGAANLLQPPPPDVVQYGSFNADLYDYLQNLDDLDYDKTAEFTDGGADLIVNDFPDNNYVVIRYLVKNDPFTKFTETGTNNVNVPIPGVQFPKVFTLRGYRYIISDSVIFNNDPSAILTLHR